jgi:carboxypeptidase Taq
MLNDDLKFYEEQGKVIEKYSYMLYILSFDQETDCPENGKEYSLDVQNWLQDKIISLQMDPQYISCIENLYNNRSELEELKRLMIEEDYKSIDILKKIPKDELQKHFQNVSKSGLLWKRSRKTLDYSEFEKELAILVDYNFKYID